MTPHQLYPPTAATCPHWCTQQAGHSFDQREDDGTEVRAHVRAHGDDADSNRNAFSADVVQLVAWRDGAEEALEPLGIEVWIGGDTVDHHITDPAVARRLASNLMDAADSLEAIQGGQR